VITACMTKNGNFMMNIDPEPEPDFIDFLIFHHELRDCATHNHLQEILVHHIESCSKSLVLSFLFCLSSKDCNKLCIIFVCFFCNVILKFLYVKMAE
jgi:hypothetical protein